MYQEICVDMIFLVNAFFYAGIHVVYLKKDKKTFLNLDNLDTTALAGALSRLSTKYERKAQRQAERLASGRGNAVALG